MPPRWFHDSTSPSLTSERDGARWAAAWRERQEPWDSQGRRGREKRSLALLPAHEWTEETIVEYEVEYKLSWGDRAGNQSTSCPSFLPLYSSFVHHLPSRTPFWLPRLSRPFVLLLVFLISNFTRRQPAIGWAHCTVGKNFGKFRFEVTNSPARAENRMVPTRRVVLLELTKKGRILSHYRGQRSFSDISGPENCRNSIVRPWTV